MYIGAPNRPQVYMIEYGQKRICLACKQHLPTGRKRALKSLKRTGKILVTARTAGTVCPPFSRWEE